MNLNELAREVCSIEEGEMNLSIAQVKEVLHCLGVILAELPSLEALELCAKLIKAGSKKS